MESYKIIIVCILLLCFLIPLAINLLETGLSNQIETIEQIKEEDIKKFNISVNKLIESTSSRTDEYEKAIKALREPITFIEPTPDQEKLMETILNKPVLLKDGQISVNELRESMDMPPVKLDPAWEEVHLPEFRKVKMEPKGHLLALKCETCGGELNVIRNSLFDDTTFYVCKYCGNKYIFKGD